MPRYVDGYVIPIKRTKLAAYKKMADLGCKAWMKHGALSYYECVMEDFGNSFSQHGAGFKKMCKLKAGETAIFAFVVFKSKAHRNQVNKKVHKEFAAQGGDQSWEMPFDLKRFANAGCKVMVHRK